MGAYSLLLNWHIGFAVLSAILEIASLIPYLQSIIRGETKPNAVSFALWTVLNTIALAAQIESGASWSAVVIAMITVSMTIITVLALSGYGYREYGILDVGCFIFAILAIVGWQMTNNPVLAIVLAIAGDLFASVPTVVKTYRQPWTEHAGAWGIVTLAMLSGAMSTEKIDIANLAMPVYLVVVDGSIFLLAYFGVKNRKERPDD